MTAPRSCGGSRACCAIIACRGFRDPAIVLGARFDPEQNPLTRRLHDRAAPIVLGDVRTEPTFDHQPDDLHARLDRRAVEACATRSSAR